MKYLILLLIILFGGCAVYWTDDVFIATCMKDYDLKELTSKSHSISASATTLPVPSLGIETTQPEGE